MLHIILLCKALWSVVYCYILLGWCYHPSDHETCTKERTLKPWSGASCNLEVWPCLTALLLYALKPTLHCWQTQGCSLISFRQASNLRGWWWGRVALGSWLGCWHSVAKLCSRQMKFILILHSKTEQFIACNAMTHCISIRLLSDILLYGPTCWAG